MSDYILNFKVIEFAVFIHKEIQEIMMYSRSALVKGYQKVDGMFC